MPSSDVLDCSSSDDMDSSRTRLAMFAMVREWMFCIVGLKSCLQIDPNIPCYKSTSLV